MKNILIILTLIISLILFGGLEFRRDTFKVGQWIMGATLTIDEQITLVANSLQCPWGNTTFYVYAESDGYIYATTRTITASTTKTTVVNCLKK